MGLEAPDLPADRAVPFILGTAIYLIGGLVFVRSVVGELRARMPGMMTLVALGITAAYAYSPTVTFGVEGEGFYWELATLVDVMLLGHWIEMAAVGRAQGALAELGKLLPNTAERVAGERTEEVRVSELATGDLVLVRPGARIPAPLVVLLPPAVGALLMSVSTVVVALNAQLLRRDPALVS